MYERTNESRRNEHKMSWHGKGIMLPTPKKDDEFERKKSYYARYLYLEKRGRERDWEYNK